MLSFKKGRTPGVTPEVTMEVTMEVAPQVTPQVVALQRSWMGEMTEEGGTCIFKNLINLAGQKNAYGTTNPIWKT